MSKLHKIIDALIGLRKLFFTVLTIILISAILILATAIFVGSWYLDASVFSGDNLAQVYQAGFQYIAAIAGGYLAVNVANKWVGKWISKRK